MGQTIEQETPTEQMQTMNKEHEQTNIRQTNMNTATRTEQQASNMNEIQGHKQEPRNHTNKHHEQTS